MLGFKSRTSDADLRNWEKKLNINSDILSTKIEYKVIMEPTEKDERNMVRDIKRR